MVLVQGDCIAQYYTWRIQLNHGQMGGPDFRQRRVAQVRSTSQGPLWREGSVVYDMHHHWSSRGGTNPAGEAIRTAGEMHAVVSV